MEQDHYLAQVLIDVGSVSYTGMGASPITWTELASYMALTNTHLTSFEVQAISSASAAYAAELNQAGEGNAIEPNRPASNAKQVDESIDNAFGALMKAQKNG